MIFRTFIEVKLSYARLTLERMNVWLEPYEKFNRARKMKDKIKVMFNTEVN